MSVCQLRCPGCPTTTREIAPVIPPGYLKADQFARFLDENRFVREVELSNFGELLLNPELPEILKIAFRRKVALSAENGLNLNRADDELLRQIVRYRLRSATISIDGASRSTYGQYRVGGDFDRVVHNIRKLNTFKKEYRSAEPRLAWQFVLFEHNAHEIEKARSLAADLEMEFRLKLSWDRNAQVKVDDSIRAQVPGGIVTQGEYEKKHGRHYTRSICYQLWTEPQLNWDGKVLGCCINYWGEFGGNAFDDGLLSCLNGDGMRYAREMLTGKADSREDIPCTTCEQYLFMKERGDWITRSEMRNHHLVTKSPLAPIYHFLGIRKITNFLKRKKGRRSH